MISPEEARIILLKEVSALTGTEQIAVSASSGYTLATEIISPLDLPPFNQSNVDGYALGIPGSEQQTWIVVEEIPAGSYTDRKLQPGEAARIFTGAYVPEGSACIVMQERTTLTGNVITCTDEFQHGKFIRLQGSHIKKGDRALQSHHLITPAVISFLDGMGIADVSVFRKPAIALIITGNELEKTKGLLEKGKNHESLASALNAALHAMGLNASSLQFVKDDKAALSKAIQEGLKADMLVVTGGISVGDYDYVAEILTEQKTHCLFHGIEQKPGKPLYFGKSKTGYVFALPGNPASALCCFYEYVYTALRILQNRKELFLKIRRLTLMNTVVKKPGLAFYLKARVQDTVVEVPEGQDSFIMKSLAEANAFVYLPAQQGTVNAGEIVEVHLLPEI
ncbi:MAG: molybdopterin molybdotransferase MoeA [Bacteroidia bacterium]